VDRQPSIVNTPIINTKAATHLYMLSVI
jgi:hypothetical protein